MTAQFPSLSMPLSLTAPRRRLIGFGAVFLVLSGLLAWWSGNAFRQSGMQDIEARGRQRLGLYLSSFRNHLEKYEYLPGVLAQDRDVRALLRNPGDARLVQNVNARLARLNMAARTSVLYVMGLDGTTQAASNWSEPTSFVGQNYSFRPYFQNALAHGSGHFFAIGATTGQPAFFFAEAVQDTGGAIGAVVVRLDIEPLQHEWEQAGEAVLLADEFGVVFLSSRPDWRFTALQPLDAQARQTLEETRKYSGIALRPLALRRAGHWNGAPLVTIAGRSYLRQEQPLPAYHWQLVYLSDTAPAANQGRMAVFTTLAGCALLALTFLFLRQYRLRQQAREAVAETLRQARDELEVRVTERTRDLQTQIAERERTESSLREAQDELVQAGKLAALGQMSAAIAHEINQPLTAISTYAAASRVQVARGDLASVTANLSMIEDLTRRMAEISRHLKTFARKSAADRKPVALRQVIRQALTMLDGRLRLEGVEVRLAVPETATVAADDIRIEQVLINLLRNACDAMADSSLKQLDITAAPEADGWSVRIADTGIGISPEHMPHLFDPFFTTKQKAEGLGLGLAISHGIVRDFGGTLAAENSAGGGAVFTVWLPVQPDDMGAGRRG